MISTSTANYKEMFLEYAKLIKRDDIEGLLEWLKDPRQSDFFTAPASTKYHSNTEGGLCMHSVKVFERLKGKMPELRREYPSLSDEELLEKIAIVALFHDLCKINFYVTAMRNVKTEDGKWTKVPYFTVEDQLPLGHSPKSIYYIMKYLDLKDDEAAAILAHMGDFADQSTGLTYQKYPLAIHLHIADLEATYLDEQIYQTV